MMSHEIGPTSSDPAWHKALERRVQDHVLRLLEDRRFVVPTTFGPRPINTLQRDVERWDRGQHLKERLLAHDKPDFDLQDRMPLGSGFDVRLSRQVLLAFTQTIGHIRFASLVPTDALIEGRVPAPLTAQEVREMVASLAPLKSDNGSPPGPMTLILLSSSGFAADARETARTFVDGPPTLLIEPNSAGGFDLTGPPGSEPLQALLDPEAEAEQRRRAREAIEARRIDLITGAIALDAVARETHLPMRLVEQEARQWAAGNPEGVRVKAIDGVPMLFRDASLASVPASPSPSSSATTAMPVSASMMDRLRKLFGGPSGTERKISYLAERRAALSRQRDLAYEELGALEDKEHQLRDAFKQDESVLARRRITSQLVQLGKDIERRRQTVGVLNQQINVVGTHLHNLEIARQGSTASLPSTEEIAEDAARAEEVLAELQASSELADELSGSLGSLGLSSEEAALYEQLAAEAAGQNREPATLTHGEADEMPAERLINAQRARDAQAQHVTEPARSDGEKVAETTLRESPASPTQPPHAEPEPG